MVRRAVLRPFWVSAVDAAFLRCIALAVCFFVGAMMGRVWACGLDHQMLGAYLRDFCAAADGEVSLVSCVVLYYGYVLLAFLLGFSSVGVLLIPALSSVMGFLSMYVITCFAGAFGRQGIVLALGVLAVRLLFTVPCFFCVASAAWGVSGALAWLVLGQGKRTAPVRYGKSYFLLCLLCVVVLTAGILCERLLTPVLFHIVLDRFF